MGVKRGKSSTRTNNPESGLSCIHHNSLSYLLKHDCSERTNNSTPQAHADAYVSRITYHDNNTVQGNVWLEHLRRSSPQTLSVAVEPWAAWSVELHGHLHPRATTQPQRLSALTSRQEPIPPAWDAEHSFFVLKRPPHHATTRTNVAAADPRPPRHGHGYTHTCAIAAPLASALHEQRQRP